MIAILKAYLRISLTAFLLCAVLLSSCIKKSHPDGYMVLRLMENPTTLDPALITDVDAGAVAAKLFNGLVVLGPGMKVVPDIAKNWSLSPDGLVYEFTLHDDVQFQNGLPVRAGDFKYSFERVLAPKMRSPNTWVLERIAGAREFMDAKADAVKGIEVVDALTLRITLERPFSPFLGLLTMAPGYVVSRKEVEARAENFGQMPAGTGPFVLKSWTPNGQLVLAPSARYHGPAPQVRGLVYRIIPEDLTAVAEFEVGNLDALIIPQAVYGRYARDPKWQGRISTLEGLNTYYVGINCKRPGLDNPEFRRALNMAIDRGRILNTLYEGRGRLAAGPVPEVLRAWPVPQGLRYDPKEAMRIIDKLGMRGRVLWFYIKADQQVVDMAEVIQAQLKEVGLDVRLRQLEWSAFKNAVNKGEADLFWLSWWADYPDPENFLYPLFHSSNQGPAGNRTWYASPEADALIEAGARAVSIEGRNDAYMQAERVIVNDAPWVFLWHRTDHVALGPALASFPLYPIYSMDKGLDIRLATK